LIRRWLRLFSEFTAAQAVIQLIGIGAGLLIVNVLPVAEYALYTFAMSVFTFLTVFSDLGVSNALLYFRRTTRVSASPFMPYVRAAFTVRHLLLLLGAVSALSFMALVGQGRGFHPLDLAAAGALVVVAAWLQIGAAIHVLLLRLGGNYRASYFAEALGSAIRALAIVAMWVASAAFAWLAVLASGLAALATRLSARHAAMREPDACLGATSPDAMKGIAWYLVPTALSAVYFAIQAPLVVWLSAYFAGTEALAEVGALSRLGLLFGLAAGFIGAVLMPRLAAVTEDVAYRKRYLESWIALAALGIAVIGFAYLFPRWLLFLLGDSYAGLDEELLIVAATSVLHVWGGYCVGINNSRGWVRRQPLVLMVYATIQVLLVARLDLSTTAGVLHFALWSAVVALVLQLAMNAAGFARPEWVMVEPR
jgi:O-antigen/teichoic acid export membrane protein